MKLQSLRISNFQSFGPTPTYLSLDKLTYLIGPNGSGKTAVLQALCRLFAFDPAMRRMKRADFHVPHDEEMMPNERKLWIEADFIFPELDEDDDNTTVAPNFGHMRLDVANGDARVRYRLDATLDEDGEIEESLAYVLDLKEDGTPLETCLVPKAERSQIHVHYLPARRDPSDHIAYGANALLGRLLRSVNWEKERTQIKDLTDQISNSLAANPSVAAFGNCLKDAWGTLHKGSFFADPKITFVASEIESLLRHLSVSFSPSHDENLADFSRLSDGQKSMLYLSLVISAQAIGRSVLAGDDDTFDPEKLRPPVFTLIAIEEPENSLSPHFLGRIVNSLANITSHEDAQALIATHAPSLLRRVDPEHIRYLRLTERRITKVKCIVLPKTADVAHKFVREAVQAFPEIYFSRLVVLGEGDSEEIVLPRILKAKGAPVDESAVTIAPLGGRHVNHFWRLLSELEIPYITLLDLDVARHGGGWGRIKYVNDQLAQYQPDKILPADHGIPPWNSEHVVRMYPGYFAELAKRDVYFSVPMDLDFCMLSSFPTAYQAVAGAPSESILKAVLGDSHHNSTQYKDDELRLFSSYHRNFKLGSKPAAHLEALAQLSDEELLASLPGPFKMLADAVIRKLAEMPE